MRLQKPLGIVLEELQSGGAGVEVGELIRVRVPKALTKTPKPLP